MFLILRTKICLIGLELNLNQHTLIRKVIPHQLRPHTDNSWHGQTKRQTTHTDNHIGNILKIEHTHTYPEKYICFLWNLSLWIYFTFLNWWRTYFLTRKLSGLIPTCCVPAEFSCEYRSEILWCSFMHERMWFKYNRQVMWF